MNRVNNYFIHIMNKSIKDKKNNIEVLYYFFVGYFTRQGQSQQVVPIDQLFCLR